MTETKTDECLRERKLVDVTNLEDLKYWTEQFGVSADELRTAVKFVGRGVASVEAHLRNGKVKVRLHIAILKQVGGHAEYAELKTDEA